MAQRLEFQTPPRDPREVLRARLERAPEDHAEAMLAAYDLLQQIHERGILDLARSALATSDELLAQAVDGVDTPRASRAIRNLLVWRQLLNSIDPESFKGILQAIPEGLAQAQPQRDERVTLWSVVRRAMSRDSLRGLAAALAVLESFGRHLPRREARQSSRSSK
jgi:uncharacterized protein YjgD (DUF1641 family)